MSTFIVNLVALTVGGVALLSMLFLVILIIGVVQKIQTDRQKGWLDNVSELTLRRLGGQLQRDAALFMESPETFRAIHCIAGNLLEQGRVDARAVRQVWRELNEAALNLEP